ncbi:MAG TPA: hypothetical protein VF786_11400, partial [Terriglobales bacterium]
MLAALQDRLRRLGATVALAAFIAPAPNLLAQEPGMPPPPPPEMQQPEPKYTIKVNSELVLVSVTVRDKSGKLLRDLKRSDFTVQEDGRAQKLESFDVQDVSQYAQGGPSQVEVNGAPTELSLLTTTAQQPRSIRDRRLIVLFFDT